MTEESEDCLLQYTIGFPGAFDRALAKRLGPCLNDICFFCCRRHVLGWDFPLPELTLILKDFNLFKRYHIGQVLDEDIANEWFATLERLRVCYENTIRIRENAKIPPPERPLPLITGRHIHDHLCTHCEYKVVTGYAPHGDRVFHQTVSGVIPWRTSIEFGFDTKQ